MSDLDDLLADVARTIQPTEEQNARAESAYNHVTEWLEQGPELRPYLLETYPQGSRALGTTICPLRGCEHDVDLVTQARRPVQAPPDWFYALILRRLREHGDLAKRIELMKRCIRLNYAGDFHLDVLPARPDLVRGGTCIEIPDRELRKWLPSNPRGYIAWFLSQCDVHRVMEKRAGEPLPPNTPADLKPILKRMVQLMKRHRDVEFEDNADDAPRSIVLTTLAAIAYSGEASLSHSLLGALKDIDSKIDAAAPGRIIVVNPTNPDEDFGDKFTAQSYRKFVQFVREFRAKVEHLLRTEGIDRLAALLSEMFGEEPTRKVIKAYATRIQSERESSRLRTSATGITTVGAGPLVRSNTFFGED